MLKKWMNMKYWKKWTVSICSIFVILASVATGYLYYKTKNVDLDKIIEKHQADNNSNIASEQSKETELPDIIKDQLGKASALTDKTIKADDALDVAAILMSSGLSMKEMSYLTGKSTDNLSVEEKQKIRDLLLKKLTPKEIEALRSITSQYGKYLVILDPNYPIELVGVEDKEERERILKELENKKQENNKKQQADDGTSGDDKLSPSSQTPNSQQNDTKTNTNISESNSEKKKQIDAKYTEKISSLKISCQSEASELLTEVITYVNSQKSSGNDTSVSDLQEKFMSKISTSETSCDQKFNNIVAKAKQEYKSNNIDPTPIIENWQSAYEENKRSLRSKSLSAIIATWKSGKKND